MPPAVWTDQQIVNQLDSGYHWTGTALTYVFPTNNSWFPYTNSEREGFSALTSAQQTMASEAIKLWDDLIIPNFALTTNVAAANIKYSNTTTSIGYAHAYYPGSYDYTGSVWFNPTYNASWGTNNLIPPSIGAWGWTAFVHETGHALGLDHPGTYNGGSPTYAIDALYTHDSQQYTIMSYFTADNTGADWYASNGQWYYPQTPMRDDIMAIQAIYGADMTTRSGNTVYGFNTTITDSTANIFNFVLNPHPVLCIWDGGGTDTLDLSGYSTSSLIDLTPGAFSNCDMMTYNISIAYNAWIENATTGAGNDTLIGNILANTLTGNGGNDIFTGGAGSDRIDGGIGTDTAIYSGTYASYSISWNATLGAYVLVDTRSGSPDGTDTVSNVENFTFADGTRAASTLLPGSVSTTYAITTLAASASEAITARTFTVIRTGDVSAAGSVSYAVTGSGANPANAVDFVGGVLPSGTVSFAAGVASATITINIANDSVVEADENFTVTLSNPSSGGILGTSTAIGSILNDDTTPPVISIAATDASKSEGDSSFTAFTFTVTRTGDVSAAGTVNYAVTGTGNNPAVANDFFGNALPSGTVGFAAGQASATLSINIAGDTTVEAADAFAVTLSTPSGGATLGTATAIGSILNDDTAYSIAALDAVKAEGNSGVTPFTFTVTRTGNVSAQGTVNWAVSGSDAAPASAADFANAVLPSGTVTFAAGQTSQTITINVVGDTVVEGNEGFTVTLSSPVSGFVPITEPGFAAIRTGDGHNNRRVPGWGDNAQGQLPNPSGAATITTATAVGTIQNDDATSLAIAAASAVMAEGNAGTTPFTFTVTRSGDVSAAGSVAYAVTGSAASPADAADFAGAALPSGIVNFAAGASSATITVDVVGDIAGEPDNGFTVTLSNSSGLATIAAAAAFGIIQNDDPIPTHVGTAGNDSINLSTSTASNVIDISQGGADSVTGGTGQDIILLGATLTAADALNGGAGNDTVILQGNYAGVIFTNTTMTNVETLVLAADGTYNITLNNGTVGNGASLTVDAHTLAADNTATVNASAERSSPITFLGGAGSDVFTGGRGDDIFVGGLGADRLAGGSGADIFVYQAAMDSPVVLAGTNIQTSGADTLLSFSASADTIDLIGFGFSGAGNMVVTATTGFSTAVASSNNYFGPGNNVAVEYGSGSTARVYVDANQNGALDSSDAMIQLTGVSVGSLSNRNFIF